MKYHSISKLASGPACRQAGFTIIEAVLSIGILLILGAITMPISISNYQRYQITNERNLLVALLREARTMSMAGNAGTDHGVHVSTSQYTIFEGTSYAGRDQSKDQLFYRETSVTITGPTDIRFIRQIGFLAPILESPTYTMSNGTKQETITINNVGRIDWQ